MTRPRSLRKAIPFAVLTVLIVVVIGFSVASLAPQPSSNQTSSTTSIGRSSSASVANSTGPAAKNTTTTLSGLDPSRFFVNLAPPNRILGPGDSAAFTLTLQDLAQFNGNLSLSVTAPLGLNFQLTPSTLSNYNSRESVDLSVRSSPTLSPGTYQATIFVKAPNQVINSTYDFKVVRYLVKIEPLNSAVNVQLTVKAGDTVTWYNADPPNDDGGTGVHNVTFQSIQVSSGLFGTDDVWSYTFQKPGVYKYFDSQEPLITGVITVTA